MNWKCHECGYRLRHERQKYCWRCGSELAVVGIYKPKFRIRPETWRKLYWLLFCIAGAVVLDWLFPNARLH